MATINAVGTSLSGQTGTGSFVGSTSPTLVTPTVGAATATSVVFSPSTGGIIGTTTNNNAGTGIVGEYVTSVILDASPVSLATNTLTNLTSISLTAGDWDVCGSINFATSVGYSLLAAWVSSTSVTLPDGAFLSTFNPAAASAVIGQMNLIAPTRRFSLSATTTTIYISAQTVFPSGVANMRGYISARRVR